MAKILFLEPFYGGSHRNFADNLVRCSSHDITLCTLPSRFWKWRMRGAALHFYKTVADPGQYDLVFLSGLMSLSDLKSLWGRNCPPAVLYMHENQLSYPLPEGSRIDYQFGFTDITSALNAEQILFNSHFHKNEFFSELPLFLNRMPEYVPGWIPGELKEKSAVVYPGIDFSGDDSSLPRPAVPRIVWNHRWEFDKQPQFFFHVVNRLARDGIKFELSLLGENFQAVPKEFIKAKKHHASRIKHYGWQESRQDYLSALNKGSIVISTAIQENFGISIIEAILAGCLPLLPDRLVYPELLPESLQPLFMYRDEKDLYKKLKQLINDPPPAETGEVLRKHYSTYLWKNMIGTYDRIFSEVTETGRK